jgi:hypothetical protein
VEFAEYRPGLASPLEIPEPELALPPEDGDRELPEPRFLESTPGDLEESDEEPADWEDEIEGVTVADDPPG